jgi:hypothetical protein
LNQPLTYFVLAFANAVVKRGLAFVVLCVNLVACFLEQLANIKHPLPTCIEKSGLAESVHMVEVNSSADQVFNNLDSAISGGIVQAVLVDQVCGI